MILIFDSSKDDLMVNQWTAHVDQVAKQYNWDDRIIVRLITSRLQECARVWYDTRKQIMVTWTDIKRLSSSLALQFLKSISFCRLLRRPAFMRLVDYCFHKLNKLRKLDLVVPDKYLIDMVIEGIIKISHEF